MAGELVQASVELASHKLEVAQLRQALTSRVWIEQANGVLAASQGTAPEVAFQQLRARARASSRKLAALAREVVQEAEARAQAAEQTLKHAQADLTRRQTALDQAQAAAHKRDRIADERNHAADERNQTAGQPDPP